jgi:FAD/FMN-containing dehydrogenase
MKKNKFKASSWNFQPKPANYTVQELTNYSDLKFIKSKSYLAHGMGRSYGDVCLNNGGELIFTRSNNKITEFDKKKGYLICESGITVNEILNFIAPNGWFLPVVPGTSFVTIGGAISNDIHGKNHHKVGTFGNFVEEIKILRSNGDVFKCSRKENIELFNATIGGLGLTGLIIEVKIKLLKINNEYVETSTERFYSYDEFLSLNKKYTENYDYTVSWIDFKFDKASDKIRGVFIYGNHLKKSLNKTKRFRYRIPIPFKLPFSVINNLTLNFINGLYFFINKNSKQTIQHYTSFFFPLDIIRNWNRAYGKRGFYQYQFVVPDKDAAKVLNETNKLLKKYNQRACLGVLKTFGSIKSNGILSFPKQGVTLALDLQNKGSKTLLLMDELDKIVMKNDGRLYPAKDSRMSRDVFQHTYPDFNSFKKFIDPNFSSSFHERVF